MGKCKISQKPGGVETMRMINGAGQAIYYNIVDKGGLTRYIILAASGQHISGRDRQKRKSRTFTQEAQAINFIKKNGYFTPPN
jgi:hypothetical protein